MTPEETGTILLQARDSLQLKQSVLCRLAGIAAPRLSKLESGKCFPAAEEWERLAAVLHLGPWPGRPKLPVPRGRWSSKASSLPIPSRALEARIEAARSSYGAVLDSSLLVIEARPDRDLCFEFLSRSRFDSADELHFCCLLLAYGANPCRFSPQKAGYRALPIVHPDDGQVIGDERWACLELVDDDLEFLIFPQIPLIRKGSYQLDFLLAVRFGNERFWVNVEIDGSGHRGRFDIQREKRLHLATLRVTPKELELRSLFLCC